MPYKKVTLGPLYSVRISDLLTSDVLCVECDGCGRKWRVFPAQLISKNRSHVKIKDVIYFFRCEDCHSRVCTWHIERAVSPNL